MGPGAAQSLGGIKSQASGQVHAMVDAIAIELGRFGIKAKRGEVERG